MSWMLERVGVFFFYIYPQSLHCSSVLKREMKMMKRITKKLTGLDEEPMYAGYWGWYTWAHEFFKAKACLTLVFGELKRSIHFLVNRFSMLSLTVPDVGRGELGYESRHLPLVSWTSRWREFHQSWSFGVVNKKKNHIEWLDGVIRKMRRAKDVSLVLCSHFKDIGYADLMRVSLTYHLCSLLWITSSTCLIPRLWKSSSSTRRTGGLD